MRPPIELEGLISAEDYVRAQRLHHRSGFAWVIRIVLVVMILGIAGLLAVNGAFLGATAVASVLLLFAVAPWVDPWRWRRMYRRQPGLHEPVRGELGDEGIGYRSPFGEGLLPWRFVVKARMDDRTILVYQAPNLFNLLPRGLFASDDEWRRARELVREKVGRGAAERLTAAGGGG
jgi:hypothetical protein